MNRTQMLILFFTVVLLIYGLLNLYFFLRGREVLPAHARFYYTIVFWLLASAYLVGRVAERFVPSTATTVLIWIGSYWLGVMAYGVVLLLTIDIARLILHVVPWFSNVRVSKEIVGGGVVCVLVVAILLSRINALNPLVQRIHLSVQKHLPQKAFTIAAVSDIHLGTMVCNSHFERIVNEINALQPDIILLVGDIVDEDVEPVIRNNFGELLQNLKAPYGVYGVTGNHEYIGGVEQTCAYLERQGIRMLRDSVVEVAGITLVGREDISIRQFNGKGRKSLQELLNGVSREKPIIVLDHQPRRLQEAAESGVDLQLSGHTHHGQLFPFNFIASAVYEKSWGYLQKGGTHFYISCGVGTWGPPLRSGNRPEIVFITLQSE